MFSEEDLLPLSAIADFVFCERRAALHIIEGVWDDNVFTVEGTLLHERTDDPGTESRGDVRIARALRLRSLRLGLSAKTDVVEFHRVSGGNAGAPPAPADSPLPPFSPSSTPTPPDPHALPQAIAMPGVLGLWRPFPVEYKRGHLKAEPAYIVQLCAQALCLEEMLHVQVPQGALFYGKTMRRLEVVFDNQLRQATEAAARQLHELFRSQKTPHAVYEKKCDKCSLYHYCKPKTIAQGNRSAQRYLKDALRSLTSDL